MKKQRILNTKKFRIFMIFYLILGIGSAGWFLYSKLTKEKKPRLILLGLDGADWDIIDHYILKGKLPTFERLKREGAWGYLQSLEPTLSPMLWTTIATGKKPAEHGIVDFLEWDDQKKERLPVTSQHRKVPAIWNILTQHKKKVGVFNWLVTWPAEEVNGVLVSDRLGYHIFPRIIGPRLTLEQVSYPYDYAEKKKRLFSSLEKITYKEVSQFLQISKEEFKEQAALGQFDVQNPDMNLRLALSTFKTFKNFSMNYWKKEDPDFMALYFDIPDTLMHTFMDYSPPKLERISLRKFQKYKNTVEATHIMLDRFIGELIDDMDENTHLIIVSDHGFKFGKERPNMPATIGKDNEVHWHDNQGIVLFWGKQFQKQKQLLSLNLYDIVPTVLNFFNLPVARDMEGKIASAAFRPEFFKLDDIRYTSSYDDVAFGPREIPKESRSAEVDKATKDKLASLGYIQMEEEAQQKNRFQTRNPFLEAVQFQKAGNNDKAVEIYFNILDKEPDNKNTVSIYNSLALIFRNKGDYRKAKRYIRKAIQKEKTLSSLYINLGNIEKQFGYHEKAFQAYKKAIRMDPQDGMAYYAMGLLYEEQQKWHSAEAAYKEALKKKVNISALPSRIMTMLEKQHKGSEAKKMQDFFALQQTPDQRFRFFIEESQRYISENRLKSALEALFEALRIQPKNSTLYNDIGGVFLRQNNKTKAINYFKRALELDPGQIISYLNLASAYLEINQPQKSKHYLQQALKLDPRNKHAYYLLGLAQMRLMEHRMAKFNFQKALKLDPNFAEAKDKLKRIQKALKN